MNLFSLEKMLTAISNALPLHLLLSAYYHRKASLAVRQNRVTAGSIQSSDTCCWSDIAGFFPERRWQKFDCSNNPVYAAARNTRRAADAHGSSEAVLDQGPRMICIGYVWCCNCCDWNYHVLTRARDPEGSSEVARVCHSAQGVPQLDSSDHRMQACRIARPSGPKLLFSA